MSVVDNVVIGLDSLTPDRPTAVAIGSFDGVHIGHRELLRRARRESTALGRDFVIVTLDPVPQVVLRPELRDFQITDRALKVRLLARTHPDMIAVVPFTIAVSHLGAADFLALLLDHLHVADLWMGDDFRFGHDREGGLPYLMERGKQDGFTVHVVSRRREEAGVAGASSSAIRDALHEGQLAAANRMLGYTFELSGPIVHGQARGRALGYPTANLDLPPVQIVPAAGVYAGVGSVRAYSRPAAISVGTNPQFDGTTLTVEAFLLDFDDDIYGETLSLRFVERLRGQHRFPDIAALQDQMAQDVEQTRSIVAAQEIQRV